MNKTWHTLTQKQIFRDLHTSPQGLSDEQIEESRKKHGENVLPAPKQDSLWVIFFRQFQSPLIYILIIASIIVFIFKEYSDAGIILFVLAFNALVGTFQEGKARNALFSLNRLVKTQAVVIRNGEENVIEDTEVVVGDVLLIQEGDKVPADARLISAASLKVDESALTGESLAVHKTDDVIPFANMQTSDMKNMVFKGTAVSVGRGSAIVTAVGINTVIGGISQAVSKIDTEDPLKHDVRKLSKFIIIVTTCVVGFLFLYGVSTGREIKEMFATSVSMTVSLIPEGLPVVLTLVLATGVWRMSKKNALVKKLQAVESLGQASVIALDKTGTITKNEMVIEKIYLDEEIFDVTGSGYEPNGEISQNGSPINLSSDTRFNLLGQTITASATAEARFVKEKQIWQILGDPTEAAVAVLGEKLGFIKSKFEDENKKIADLPFTYETRYHASLHKIGQENIVSIIGAPETILSLASHIYRNSGEVKITEQTKKILDQILSNMGAEGLRIVAVATKRVKKASISTEDIENLTLIGFLGMRDAIRPNTYQSIEIAKRAGLKVIMITGDHKSTAKAVATEVGIYREGDKILTGAEIDLLSDEGFMTLIPYVTVFARVSPDHKLKIIQAYRDLGEIVAMTGDGVNDAPPLVAADLGVSMGKIGTEVAKEASDIVLLDDNFGNIISAIEEGRSIYKTVKKVILYLFSTSLGEVLTIAVSMFMGLPLPIIASQIIWLNFVTDGFLTIAVAMEPKESGLLTKKSLIKHNSFVDGTAVQRMILMALPMTVGSIWLFTKYVEGDYLKASTIALTVMAVFQWFNAWNCRSEKKSIFSTNLFSNLYLIAGTAIVLALQLLAVYNPFFQKILRTTELSFSEWMIIVGIAASIVVIEEIRKFIHRTVT